jgi:hypothetical protein
MQMALVNPRETCRPVKAADWVNDEAANATSAMSSETGAWLNNQLRSQQHW